MAVMEVRNDSKGWLTMWLEPFGEDRWLKPDETFRIRSDYDGAELAFSVNIWVDGHDRSAGIENISVWIEQGDCYAEVVDNKGNVIECGHQRPAEVHRRWQAMDEEIRKRAAGQQGA